VQRDLWAGMASHAPGHPKDEQQMRKPSTLVRKDVELAEKLWGHLPEIALEMLKELTEKHRLHISSGDLVLVDRKWYVTHSGLLSLARRHRCRGIRVEPVHEFCDPKAARWTFKATVFRSSTCKGFVGYGDADPSNVSPLLRGSELRIAETRATARALRKAFAIPVCSFEEFGPIAEPTYSERQASKFSPQPANGNYGGPKVRDRLCQIIRQHQLDPNLVKSYAVDFCRTKTLREATREQLENFVVHLADWAEKDRNAPLCQLNSYLPAKGSAA